MSAGGRAVPGPCLRADGAGCSRRRRRRRLTRPGGGRLRCPLEVGSQGETRRAAGAEGPRRGRTETRRPRRGAPRYPPLRGAGGKGRGLRRHRPGRGRRWMGRAKVPSPGGAGTAAAAGAGVIGRVRVEGGLCSRRRFGVLNGYCGYLPPGIG